MEADLAGNDSNIRASRIFEFHPDVLQVRPSFGRDAMSANHHDRIFARGCRGKLDFCPTLIVSNFANPFLGEFFHHLPVMDQRPIGVDRTDGPDARSRA